MDIYSVLIIGAGQIGALFDAPGSTAVLTHAHGFTGHGGFRLVGFVDPDMERAERAASIWGGEAYGSVAAAFASSTIDVAVLAAPDGFHYSLLKELANQPLRLVFTEKPLTQSLAQGEEIIRLYQERSIPLLVNYSRRFVPEFVDLRDEIASGSLGSFLSGTGYYGKGTLHNGSHLVDLLNFLVGEVAEIRRFASIEDYCCEDSTCSALLTLKSGGRFVMQALDCRYFTIFEIDLFFEQARIRIVDSGFTLERYAVKNNELFAGYRNMQVVKTTSTSLGTALSHAAKAVYRFLSQGGPLTCSGADGLTVQRVCLEIRGTST